MPQAETVMPNWWDGGLEKVGKVPDDKDSESSASNEESDESGRGWLAKFSTMKVGPPKGVRHVMSQADMTRRHMEKELTSLQRPVRMAGEEAKKRLEWYHES